jgi:hypothetical protein
MSLVYCFVFGSSLELIVFGLAPIGGIVNVKSIAIRVTNNSRILNWDDAALRYRDSRNLFLVLNFI